MDGSKAPLLIIDDDGWTRYVLGRIMGQHGWRVSTAATVAEALELLGSAPACIILDLNLPDGSGAQVLQEIRKAGLTVRVVVSTAMTDESTLEAVRRLNPDAIVQKPVRMQQLLEVCSV